MNSSLHLLEMVFRLVCEASLTASALFLIVRVLQRLCGPVLGPTGCYALSLLVLGRMLLLWVPSGSWSLSNLMRAWPRTVAKPDLPYAPNVQPPAVLSSHPIQTVEASSRSHSPARYGFKPIAGAIWLTGTMALLVAVISRQRRFHQWASRLPGEPGDRVNRLLACARAKLDVKVGVQVRLTPASHPPALMGWRKPCLLLPQSVHHGLDDRQLLMVLMHEMAHVKRSDVLWNWLMIVAQALHWFNPIAWLAMRRLRADRELVCDAIVLQTLAKEERRIYGGTLLRVLELFAHQAPCPTVISVLTNKHEIKRRISMIPKFSPPKRATWALTVSLLAVLCAVSFTRASDQKKAPALNPEPSSPTATREAGTTLDQLHARLDELDARIRHQQEFVDELRAQFGMRSDVADGQSSSSLEPETVRMIERERITSESMAARYETLYKELKSRSPSEMAQALPTAVPDSELTQLLRDLNTAQSRYARLTQDFGPENQQVKTAAKEMETIRTQIQARVDGILTGLAAQVAAQRASADTLSNRLEQAKVGDAESAQKYRPYFRAKRELTLLEKVRDDLMLQYLQKQFGLKD